MTNEFNKKIKILLVGPVPPPYGGIPAYVNSLRLANIENTEFILFNTANPAWVEPFSREGKRNYASIFEFGVLASIRKVLYIVGTFISLIRDLVARQPSIVQVFTSSYWGYWRSWVYVLISKITGKQTIFHLLGAIDLFYEEVGAFQKFLLRQSMNSADCYLMQSPGLEAWAKKYSRKQVYGIWNGIDFTKIAPILDAPPQIIESLNVPIGLTMGNLSTNKGTVEIIDALVRMKKKDINFHWIFIGRGDVEGYQLLAGKKGLSKNISFLGEVSEFDKWQYLHHASFFCLPSFAEGQPISIIEAMACKLPIISTKVGSIPEMIADNVNGILITPGATNALVDAIMLLLNNALLRTSMGNESYNIALERHKIEDLYSALSKLYFQMGNNSGLS